MRTRELRVANAEGIRTFWGSDKGLFCVRRVFSNSFLFSVFTVC